MYRQLRNTTLPVGVDPPYPNHLLSVGSNNSEVARMQTYLNAIGTAYYHQLPKLNVDGIYGANTKSVVTQFQLLTGLKADGVIGKNTWDKIVTDYNSIAGGGEYVWPGITLGPGQNSDDVKYMQGNLNYIDSLYTAIPRQSVDGIYGSNMSTCVRLFQKQFGLSADGLLGHNTWERILQVASGIETNHPVPVTTRYPGSVVMLGSSGDSVRFIQSYLNHIREAHHYSWPILTVDGIFGSATQTAVYGFQAEYNLKVDGKVGPNTWARLIQEFNATL